MEPVLELNLGDIKAFAERANALFASLATGWTEKDWTYQSEKVLFQEKRFRTDCTVEGIFGVQLPAQTPQG